MGVGGKTTPRPIYSREGDLVQKSVLYGCGKSHPHRVSIPGQTTVQRTVTLSVVLFRYGICFLFRRNTGHLEIK